MAAMSCLLCHSTSTRLARGLLSHQAAGLQADT